MYNYLSIVYLYMYMRTYDCEFLSKNVDFSVYWLLYIILIFIS